MGNDCEDPGGGGDVGVDESELCVGWCNPEGVDESECCVDWCYSEGVGLERLVTGPIQQYSFSYNRYCKVN